MTYQHRPFFYHFCPPRIFRGGLYFTKFIIDFYHFFFHHFFFRWLLIIFVILPLALSLSLSSSNEKHLHQCVLSFFFRSFFMMTLSHALLSDWRPGSSPRDYSSRCTPSTSTSTSRTIYQLFSPAFFLYVKFSNGFGFTAGSKSFARLYRYNLAYYL